jgi:hypothetical protein
MTPAKSTTSTTTPNPAIVANAVAAPAQKTKQQLTIEKLIATLVELRKISAKKIDMRNEGSKVIMLIAANWPAVEIGRAGGINIPALKSYASAFEAAIHGDELLAKQQQREAKALAAKAAPPTPPVAKTKDATPATPKQQEATK